MRTFQNGARAEMKTTVANYAFNEVKDLKKTLLEVCFDAADEDAVIYIENRQGQIISHARLREDTLTDGSKAYTLVLIEEQ